MTEQTRLVDQQPSIYWIGMREDQEPEHRTVPPKKVPLSLPRVFVNFDNRSIPLRADLEEMKSAVASAYAKNQHGPHEVHS